MEWPKLRDGEPENEEPEKPSDIPKEPNGAELTIKRDQQEDIYKKMEAVANEITRLLQQEQQRQQKYPTRGKRNATRN